MGEVKFDLSRISPERLEHYFGEEEFRNNIPSFVSRDHAGLFRNDGLTKTAKELASVAAKEIFVNTLAPKIAEAHEKKTQRFSFTPDIDRPSPSEDDPRFKVSCRVFHLKLSKVTKQEDNTLKFDVYWKLNNPIIYPEMAVPQRKESSPNAKKYNEYWEKGFFCDVTFRIHDQEFKAHKIILSAFSQYFEKLFTGSFKEQTENKFDLSQEGLNPASFKKLLQFAYGQKVSFKELSLEDIISFAIFANKIDAPDLYKLCQNKIAGRVSKENFKEVLEFAAYVSHPDMIAVCKHFLYFNPDWIDEVDLDALDSKQLIQFQKIAAILSDEKTDIKIVQALKCKLDNTSFTEVATLAKTLADKGEKELKQHCKRYWKVHKGELMDNSPAKKARLLLSEIE